MAKLLPDRHPTRDLFVADILHASPKDDVHSMEHPLFAVSKKKDNAIRRYEHNGNAIEIAPGFHGMPTIWDKDVLIFAASQMVEGLNRGREDAKERIVRFRAYDYFIATNRATSGAQYDRLQAGLDRLAGMRIKTNIMTGKVRIKENFGIIDWWRIVEKSADDSKMVAIEMQLSQWMHNSIQAKEVLTLHGDYFRLTGSLERRVYEIARKHCGNQPVWSISEENLYKKSGSTDALRNFRQALRAIVADNKIPDYAIEYDEERRMVKFKTRDPAKLIAHLIKATT